MSSLGGTGRVCGRYANIFKSWADIWIGGELQAVPEYEPRVSYNIIQNLRSPLFLQPMMASASG